MYVPGITVYIATRLWQCTGIVQTGFSRIYLREEFLEVSLVRLSKFTVQQMAVEEHISGRLQ